MSEHVVKLEYPFTYTATAGGTSVSITEVKMRRLKAKDLTLIDFDAIAKNPTAMFPVISELSGLPVLAVGEIDMLDLKKLTELISSFLRQSLATGEN